MRRLFRGLPSRRWHYSATARSARAELRKIGASGGVPIPQPGPQPRELLDVLGVGVSQIHGPTTVTLLSLERYREGFILQFRLLRERHHPRKFFMPQMDLSIVDGRATRYTVWSQGGGGGGGPDGVLEYRYAYAGTPALPQEAGEITIEAPEVRWQRHDDKDGRLVFAEADAGPWRFVIALPLSNVTS